MAKPTKIELRLTSEQRRALPTTVFGVPETREFPLIDPEHIRSAERYFRYASENVKPALARRILRKANELGVDVQNEVIRGWAKKEW